MSTKLRVLRDVTVWNDFAQDKQQLCLIPVVLCLFFSCLLRDLLSRYSSLHSEKFYTAFLLLPEMELSGKLDSSNPSICLLRLLLFEKTSSQWLHFYYYYYLFPNREISTALLYKVLWTHSGYMTSQIAELYLSISILSFF